VKVQFILSADPLKDLRAIYLNKRLFLFWFIVSIMVNNVLEGEHL